MVRSVSLHRSMTRRARSSRLDDGYCQVLLKFGHTTFNWKGVRMSQNMLKQQDNHVDEIEATTHDVVSSLQAGIDEVFNIPDEQLKKFKEVRINIDWIPNPSISFIPK